MGNPTPVHHFGPRPHRHLVLSRRVAAPSSRRPASPRRTLPRVTARRAVSERSPCCMPRALCDPGARALLPKRGTWSRRPSPGGTTTIRLTAASDRASGVRMGFRLRDNDEIIFARRRPSAIGCFRYTKRQHHPTQRQHCGGRRWYRRPPTNWLREGRTMRTLAHPNSDG